MRLWSIHPGYLDRQGLLGVWREALLAQQVLLGSTKGYRHHPQLERFKSQGEPLKAIAAYLEGIYQEGVARGYSFNKEKILSTSQEEEIPVTEGQLLFEWGHLLRKLELRDRERCEKIRDTSEIQTHPLFIKIRG